MNFKQIKMIYLKTIFKSQILFTSFSLLVQNFKLQLFFFGSNQKKKKKNHQFSTEQKFLFLMR